MRKFLGALCALVMLFSISIPVSAAELPQPTTTVTYTGTAEQTYEITVPATMAPGDRGTVTVTGTWPAGYNCSVKLADTVTLMNGAQSKVLGVGLSQVSDDDGIGFPREEEGFCCFAVPGSNVASVSGSAYLDIDDLHVLFGTWTGVINYNVSIGQTA